MESFENGGSSYSCGRAKTEVFKYDDVMPGFENAMCGRRFFLNTEENIAVFESTRLRDEALNSKIGVFMFCFSKKTISKWPTIIAFPREIIVFCNYVFCFVTSSLMFASSLFARGNVYH